MSIPDVYGRWVSPLLHSISGVSGACRFQPTCSEYAMTAVAHHGVLWGTALAVWRVLRCNPFGRGALIRFRAHIPADPRPNPTVASAQMTPAIYHKTVASGSFAVVSRNRETTGIPGCRQIVRSTGTLFGRNTQS